MELINPFITFLSNQKKKPSHLTVKNYKADLKHFIVWFEKEFKNSFSPLAVTPQIIEIYKNSKTLSASSMDRHISTLRKYFFFAIAQGLITDNPFEQLYAIRYTLYAKDDSWRLKDFKNYLYVYNASRLTIKNYIKDIEQFRRWLEQVLGEKNIFDKIGTAVVDEYKHRLLKNGFSPRSINRKLSSLRKYLTWAKEEGLITEQTKQLLPKSLPSISLTSSYSPFPPLRLLQKTTKGINTALDALVVIPLAEAIYRIKRKQLFYPSPQISFSKTKNIPKSFYARYARPKWYKIPLLWILLLLFTSLSGIMAYKAAMQNAKNESVLGISNQNIKERLLTFSGILKDKRQIPIAKTIPVRFSLYNDSISPSPLWEETQSITPDKNGVFSTSLGIKSPITQRFFSDNPSLYIGIAIANDEELLPRQQIATATLAQNAQTLQGLPVITNPDAPTQNVILALDSSGNLAIGGRASPVFQATDGDFTISGQSVIFTTTPGSNKDIVLSPEGNGSIDFQKPIHNTSEDNNISGVPGAVEIADLLSVIATSSGQSALTINQNSTGPIISASSSGIAKFTLESDGTAYISGNTGIGTKNPIAKLQVSGDIAPSQSNTFDLGTPTLRFDTLYINSIVASPSGTLGFWQRKDGALSPSTITDAINLGATATSSATIHFAATDENSFIQKGNLGIGTTSPAYKLDVVGNINATGDIYKNGAAFNNPDYVFEKWATGDIMKFGSNAGASDYKGMLSLEDTEAFVLQYLQLPRVASSVGIFQRGDILLEKIEEAYIYLFDLNRKISSLTEAITTKKIISPIAQIDQIHTNIISPLASDTVEIKGKLIAQEVLAENASISGTLRAKKILAEEIEGISQNVTNITNVYQATPSADIIASYSAQSSFDFGKFSQGLISLGPSSFTDANVIGDLAVGKYLSINQNSLNVLGADFEIQPLRQGGVSFLSGLLQIDTNGNLAVFGNAYFDKNVAIKGDIVASGSATFKKLLFEGIPEAIAISDIEVSASSSAGIATISAKRSTLTINNPLVTEKSLIYITPRDQTDNQVLYLLRQTKNESFTVGIQNPSSKDVPFNWLIVN